MKKSITALLLALVLLCSVLLPAGAAEPTLAMQAAAALNGALGADLSGAAALVIENGKHETVFAGHTAGEAALSITASTQFELGELSGVFVAVTALGMAEDGLLSLDEDIVAYLPAGFVKRLSLAYPVTVRLLLTGQGGFAGRRQDLYFTDPKHAFDSLEDALLADIPEQALPPGTCHIPSPFGVALAAYVLETVAGREYRELANDYVFSPLGMHASGFLNADATPANPAGETTIPGLYPANGAYVSVGDLALFLTWMLDPSGTPVLSDTNKRALTAITQNGVLSASTLGLTAVGQCIGGAGATLTQSAALMIDLTKNSAVAVLTNSQKNALTDLPRALLSSGMPTSPAGGELYDIKIFAGVYAVADLEKRSFLGRFEVANQNVRVSANKDGTLQWGDVRLLQVSPGVFASAEEPETGVLLEFFLNDAGKVVALLHRDGSAYLPVPFYLSYGAATVTLSALLLLSAFFLLAGMILSVRRYFYREPNGKRQSIFYLLPYLFAALQSITVLLAAGLGSTLGRGLFAPVFGALSVLCLLSGILATVFFIVAFLRSFFRRRLHHRIAYGAIAFLIFQILIRLWALAPF